ncbi:hypothetical protein [Streptomyces goshikiensis]|uniref:hypothetical protein n=1 Tax=Streptomyces goshikiensis TaxID=1942 RepID=UPI0036CC8026
MTLYVVTIPGTLLTGLTPEARTELVRALRGSDPRETELGAAEDLDLLTFYPDSSAFSLRLEVEAADTAAAEAQAQAQARSNRSRFITLSHAATKSRTNFSPASAAA